MLVADQNLKKNFMLFVLSSFFWRNFLAPSTDVVLVVDT